MTRSSRRRPLAAASRWSGALALLLLAVPAGWAQEAPAGSITGLRLVPGAGVADLLIAVEGTSPRWTDFTVDAPPRIVVDVAGVANRLPSNRFDGVERGGVAGVRASQYSAGVVRVVIDLERGVPYTVTTAPGGIRVRLSTGAAGFGEWSSAAAAAVTPARLPVAAAPRSQEQARITVTFQEADIRDVLASFAEFTGRSIVPGAGVTGSVTASIRNQPWDLALEAILRGQGLAAEELPSGIIRVDAMDKLKERQTNEPLVTQTFRINYVPVVELQQTLDPLKSERGRVSANASTNTLIVTDVQRVVDDMERMLRELDVRTPQVTIQAKIIFVNRTDVEALGVTYDLKDSRGNSINRLTSAPDPASPGSLTTDNLVLLGGNSIAALGNATNRVSGPQLETVISLVLGRFTLVSFIEALQTAELSDVQAAPVVTTLDNQEAEIFVGEETPIRVVDLGAASSGTGTTVNAPRASAQLVETGIRLRVTPHITADRRILMELHAERSGAVPAAGDIGVTFQRQRGTTRLMVENGEMAVIGGLTVTEVTDTRSGIPFLMDLPVVGRLFRTDRKSEQKRDLLIMVTPHIIDDRG